MTDTKHTSPVPSPFSSEISLSLSSNNWSIPQKARWFSKERLGEENGESSSRTHSNYGGHLDNEHILTNRASRNRSQTVNKHFYPYLPHFQVFFSSLQTCFLVLQGSDCLQMAANRWEHGWFLQSTTPQLSCAVAPILVPLFWVAAPLKMETSHQKGFPFFSPGSLNN